MLTLAAVESRPDQARALRGWLAANRIALHVHEAGVALPGSYWGAPEAGISGDTLHASDDTPLHSILHEAAHIVCARAAGRPPFERDAAGDACEESAVCWLQLAVADGLPGVGWRRLAADMDAWGYSFRAGSTAAWRCRDAADAAAWLRAHDVAAWSGEAAA